MHMHGIDGLSERTMNHTLNALLMQKVLSSMVALFLKARRYFISGRIVLQL